MKLPFISFQRKGLTPETRDKTSRQTFHKKFTASHFTKPEFFRWSFWGEWDFLIHETTPLFVAGEKTSLVEVMYFPSSPCPSISPGHHHCLCRDVCDWHIPGCHSNPLQQTPNKKAQKMAFNDWCNRQKSIEKNTQNDNLWVCFLNFYPLKKAIRNLPPSVLVSRNRFSSLHPVKFSNCKHASYPKVHTWHHFLRNRVVVPFQVDLPPASEIDKSSTNPESCES